MNIAELFVNLGVKGAEKTVGALGNIRKGLGEVSSMSLEAKAGILAAMYGLERLAAASGATGTNLTNFTALTGISAKTLQQWQYAARQAGISGEELTGSLKAVQNSMTNMLLGKGAPEGLGIVARAVGFDPAKARDSIYVMEQLQKAAKALPQDVGNQVLKSFGISEGTIAAMRRGAFNPAAFAAAPLYSDKETASLDKSNIAWSNLGQKIEMAIGHLNAKHGLTLVNDISKITTEVFKMIDAFTKLAEKLKLFQLLGEVFEGWGFVFGKITEGVNKMTGGKDLKKNPVDLLGEWIANKVVGESDILPPSRQAIAGANHSTVIHQNIVHHGDAKDTKSVGDTHKAAVNHAYRQRSAQGRGS